MATNIRRIRLKGINRVRLTFQYIKEIRIYVKKVKRRELINISIIILIWFLYTFTNLIYKY